MTDIRSDFGGSVPEMYERGMAPVMFAPPAELTAQRAAACGAKSILETAAGTGQVTRLLARRCPADTRIVATDLAPAMLDLAAPHFAASPVRVSLEPGDAQALAFADASFDLVISQFGVMFFPDRAAALREARRVLRPHGRFMFTTWDGLANNPFAELAAQLISEHIGDGGAFQTAFGMTRLDEVKALVLDAGFDGFVAEVVRMDVPVPDLHLFAAGLLLGNPSAQLLRGAGVTPETLVPELARRLAAAFGEPPVARLQVLFFEALHS